MAGLRILARWMDDAVRVPGTNVRVGIDLLLGLLPGMGDLAGGLISVWFVVTGARLDASPAVLARMGLNISVDALLGAVPLIGDLFDAGRKANRRNLEILERHLSDPVATRRTSRAVVDATVAAVLAVVVLALTGAIAVGAVAGRPWLSG